MILRIGAADKVFPLKQEVNIKNKTQSFQISDFSDKNLIQGVPKSYIPFKSKEKTLNYTEDAKQLLNHAEEIAKSYKHDTILPQHILAAAIEDTETALNKFEDNLFDSGVIDSVSPLSKIANDYAQTNLLITKNGRTYFKAILNDLKEDNWDFLEKYSASSETQENLKLSETLEDMIKELGEKTHGNIDSHMLLGLSINNMSYSNILYPSQFLKNALSYTAYKSMDEINKNYMKIYDPHAIDVWNKLALGSNLAITYENSKEADRITSSIIKTINHPKHGSFNSKNTMLYVMSDNVRPETVLSEISELNSIDTNRQKIVLMNLNNLLINSSQNDDEETNLVNTLSQMAANTNEKLKIILFQSNDVFYKLKEEPLFENFYSNMVTYSIPQIQTYEARAMLNKKTLKDVKTPFTKEAKDRAVFHAANLNGIFPDKAVDLMKRISSYYGDSRKKITSKDVDEFAQIGYELFNKKNGNVHVVYDTGKTIDSLYGKETTKKDVEAIIRQIKTGKIGTRGIIISSKDNEAGSGRKYTAETIAGEAKVPFVSIDTADFAVTERDASGMTVDSPKNQMSRIFGEAKNAARQNQYKTAIIYVNNFEDFAFSNPYLPGYKQAMSQLTNEMQNAEREDVSILVIASVDKAIEEYIPIVARGFNQTISVDSPAFNKRGRKEVLIHKINETELPLAYKTLQEKEYLLNRLVNLTEYMSFVEIKSLIDKTSQIMYERNKSKADIGEFIEAYLQLVTGRTSRPEMPDYNKKVTTSHECGHATNLEVMNDLLKRRGQPWHQFRNVNFITLDPRGDFLGAVFEDRADNTDYPFEAMFTALVCSYGGYSCEKLFYDMNGSAGIAQDLAQATAAVKRGVEYFGFGYNTGQISNAVKIQSSFFYEKVYKDIDIILTNAKAVSDLITDTYKKFNEWFTQKYYKLIGTDDCMVDGDEFRRILANWKKSLSADKKEELNILDDMILEMVEASKKGIKYGQANIKKAVK